MMKLVKPIVIVLVVYLAIVVLFESLLGYFQPEAGTTMVIATADTGGEFSDRVVARLESAGQLYAAANHWPRAWYRQALANPNVQIVLPGADRADYRAVPVSGAEHDRVNNENRLGLMFKILTGFPPRYFVRLEPVVTE